jgi:small multidrug resistance pump
MSWVYLLVAIVLEVCGTTSMKLSEGFAKTIPSILIFVFYGFSMIFLTLAVKRLDISVSYAVWSGVGTGLMALVGLAIFDEPLGVVKTLALVLIIVGVVALHLG